MHKPILGITLFEEQLIRVYLLSDEFSLLKVLGKNRRIVIFTQIELQAKLKAILKEKSLDEIEIVAFREPVESKSQKLISFFANWVDPSEGAIRKINREYTGMRISHMGYLIRILVRNLFSSSIRIKKLIRFLYLRISSVQRIENSFTNIPPKLNLLLVMSLTNTESDLPLAVFYKKKGIPVIATVRSWDNLVTKGILKFTPDIFLSHSNFMSDIFIRVHGFKSEIVKTWVTPCYQNKYLVNSNTNHSKLLNVTYACIGPLLNPDEMNFIDWIQKLSVNFGFNLSILQHPKFQHSLLKGESQNYEEICFDYLNSTLKEYYSFLASQDVVILSGTTVALDALFSGARILALGFEIETQNFWESHLRSFDYLPHTKWLFDNLPITKLMNKQHLISFLSNSFELGPVIDSQAKLKPMIGHIELDYISLLEDCISDNLKD
jgi:hypothetical protein